MLGLLPALDAVPFALSIDPIEPEPAHNPQPAGQPQQAAGLAAVAAAHAGAAQALHGQPPDGIVAAGQQPAASPAPHGTDAGFLASFGSLLGRRAVLGPGAVPASASLAASPPGSPATSRRCWGLANYLSTNIPWISFLGFGS